MGDKLAMGGRCALFEPGKTNVYGLLPQWRLAYILSKPYFGEERPKESVPDALVESTLSFAGSLSPEAVGAFFTFVDHSGAFSHCAPALSKCAGFLEAKGDSLHAHSLYRRALELVPGHEPATSCHAKLLPFVEEHDTKELNEALDKKRRLRELLSKQLKTDEGVSALRKAFCTQLFHTCRMEGNSLSSAQVLETVTAGEQQQDEADDEPPHKRARASSASTSLSGAAKSLIREQLADQSQKAVGQPVEQLAMRARASSASASLSGAAKSLIRKQLTDQFQKAVGQQVEQLSKDMSEVFDYIVDSVQQRPRVEGRIGADDKGMSPEEREKMKAEGWNRAFAILLDKLDKGTAPDNEFVRQLVRELIDEKNKSFGEISISGSDYSESDPKPDVGTELEKMLGWMWSELKKVDAGALDAVSLAAATHLYLAELHPFGDGNGRLSRLLMNFVLMSAGFPPIAIPAEPDPSRQLYYCHLRTASDGDLRPFARYLCSILVQTMDKLMVNGTDDVCDKYACKK